MLPDISPWCPICSEIITLLQAGPCGFRIVHDMREMRNKRRGNPKSTSLNSRHSIRDTRVPLASLLAFAAGYVLPAYVIGPPVPCAAFSREVKEWMSSAVEHPPMFVAKCVLFRKGSDLVHKKIVKPYPSLHVSRQCHPCITL